MTLRTGTKPRGTAPEVLPEPQEAFNRYVLIEVFPMDSESAADQPPVVSVFRRCFEQARKPRQGHGDAASVCQ